MKSTGISFPFRISPTTGGVQTAQYNEPVNDYNILRQSIQQIIFTKLQERTQEKDFGCDIPKNVFDPMDTVLQTALIYSITKAIASWEPRVLINNIQFVVAKDTGQLAMIVKYNVVRTGAQDTFAVPLGSS